MSAETPRDDRGEIWRQAMQQVPQPCACRFEWRPTPDFSGEPPKQLDECGFHATARTAAQSTIAEQAKEIERLREALRGIEKALRTDSRDKSIIGDEVEYHLDGQTMYLAINAARRALGEEG